MNRATQLTTMKCSKWAGLACAALFFGCSDETEPVPDAGVIVDAGVKDADANLDTSQVPDARPDSFIDLFDVFPLPDGGCPGCIRDRCGAGINACFNNPACVNGLFCTLQMCAGGLLGDSGFSPTNIACVLGCFNGDQNLAFQALASFTCLTMTCGGACNFLDAGSDARPPIPDVQPPPEASADAPPSDDASIDAPPPDTGPGADSGETDGDGATPGDDAPADVTGADVTPETGNPPDSAPPSDTTSDATPPDDSSAADATPPDEGGAD